MKKSIEIARKLLGVVLLVSLFSVQNLAFAVNESQKLRQRNIQSLREFKKGTTYHSIDESIRENSKEKLRKRKESIVRSFKNGGYYALLIRSDKNSESINHFFKKSEHYARVTPLGGDIYQLKIPVSSDFGREYVSDVTDGKVPSKLFGEYDVIAPTSVEVLDVPAPYLSGETVYPELSSSGTRADMFQEYIHQLPVTKIAILDTGVDSRHPDLSQNINQSEGYNFIDNSTNVADDNGHGTHIAGVIGAEVNGAGTFGINASASMVPFKVLDSQGYGSSYDVIEAIDEAIDRGIPVINLSIGGYGDPENDPICQAITRAKNAGITTVVAAGNGNLPVQHFVPAGCSDAITVGSIEMNGTKSNFSNFGSGVVVYAPGTNVVSTKNGGGYEARSGTSVSSAFVAGAIVAMKSENSNITPMEIRNKLVSLDGKLDMSQLLMEGSLGNTGSGSSGNYSNFGTGSSTSTGANLGGNSGTGGTYTYSGVVSSTSSIELPPIIPNVVPDHGPLRMASIPTNGLVGEWLFDGNALDTSDQGNNGVNYSVAFGNDTSRQYAIFGQLSPYSTIRVPNSSSLQFPNNIFSMSFWVNVSGNGIFATSAKDHDRSGFDALIHVSNAETCFVIANNAFSSPRMDVGKCMSTTQTPFMNTWRHITYVIDNTTAYAYLDGTLVSTRTFPVVDFSVANTRDLYFGKFRNDSENWYPLNGKLDNIRIFNRAISSMEVRALANEFGVISGQTQTPAYWNFVSDHRLDTQVGSLSLISQNNIESIVNGGKWTNTSANSSDRSGAAAYSKDVSDPVSLSTGEFDYTNTFLQVPGVGIPYELSLKYKNQLPYQGPVGNNFDHNYNIYLVEEGNGLVRYFDGKLGIFTLQLDSQSNSVYNSAIKATLQKDVNTGIYTLVFDSGATFVFGTNKKISSMIDGDGNALQFTYNTSHQLTGVTDTLGRQYTYVYSAENKLISVTDFDGRVVEFQYYAQNEADGSLHDLKSVSIHSKGETKTIGFTYDTNHNIIHLIDAKGQVYVQNVYTTEGRVASQKYGTGTTQYLYEITDGRVAANTVTNANNVVTRYDFDTNGNISRREVKDTVGTGSTLFTYQYYPDGRLFRTIHPRGNGIEYTYDSRGNVLEEREKMNVGDVNSTQDIVTQYEYATSFPTPTRIRKPNGSVIMNALDMQGRVMQNAHSGSTLSEYVSTLITYLPNGLVHTTTNPAGLTTTYSYGSGMVLSKVTGTGAQSIQNTYAYDVRGNLIEGTDSLGNKTQYEYTPFDLVGTGTTADGTKVVSEFDSNNNRVRTRGFGASGSLISQTEFEYDLLDKETKKTEFLSFSGASAGASRVTTKEYDASQNLIRTQTGTGAATIFEYDDLVRIKKVTTEVDPAVPSKNISTLTRYDRNGNISATVDARGNTTTYEYDLFDRLIQKNLPTGLSIVYEYDISGNVVSEKSLNGSGAVLARSDASYDQLGRKISSSQYDFSGQTPIILTTHYEYDSSSNLVSITSPKGVVMHYEYDIFGRKIREIDALGNTTVISYNSESLPISQTIISAGSNTGATTSTVYDSMKRPTGVLDALGNISTMTYGENGRVSQYVDPEQKTKNVSYDFLGNILSTTQLGSNNQSVVVSYQYDTRGNLVGVTDENGNKTVYVYDSLNRKIREVYPDATHRTYEYSNYGELASVTDPNGTVVSNQYDSFGRLIAKNINRAAGVTGVTQETFEYDVFGRLIHAGNVGTSYFASAQEGQGGVNYGLHLSGSGQVISQFQRQSSNNFSYDSLSRVIQEGQTINGTNYSFGYGYDLHGNMTRMQTPTGRVVGYEYDSLDRLTALHNTTDTTAIFTQQYTGIFLSSVQYNNGITENFSYDALGRKKQKILNNSIIGGYYPSAPSQLLLSDVDFSPSGLITRNQSTSYEYTPQNYLSHVVYPSTIGSEQFTYDAAGNRAMGNRVNGSAFSEDNGNAYLTVQSGSGSFYGNSTASGSTQSGSVVLSTKTGSMVYSINALNQYLSTSQTGGLGTTIRPGVLSGSTNGVYFAPTALSSGQTASGGTASGTTSGTTNSTASGGIFADMQGFLADTQGNTESFLYDANGNLIETAKYRLSYDYQNRLTEVRRKAYTLSYMAKTGSGQTSSGSTGGSGSTSSGSTSSGATSSGSDLGFAIPVNNGFGSGTLAATVVAAYESELLPHGPAGHVVADPMASGGSAIRSELVDGSKYMQFGPYVGSGVLQNAQQYVAVFRVRVASNASAAPIGFVDVFDGAKNVRFIREIRGTDFPSVEAYRDIRVPFSMDTNTFEFRAYTYGITNIAIDSVRIEESSLGNGVRFESEDLPFTGNASRVSDTDALSGVALLASVSNNSQGYAQVGPSGTSTLTNSGTYTAAFRMKVANNTSHTYIGFVDVYDTTNGKRLAMRELRASDFSTAGQYQDIILPFVKQGNTVEYRVHFADVTDIWIDAVTVSNFVPGNIFRYEAENLVIGSAGTIISDTQAAGGRTVRASTTSALGYVHLGPGKTFLIPGEKYRAIFRIKAPNLTTASGTVITGNIATIDVLNTDTNKRTVREVYAEEFTHKLESELYPYNTSSLTSSVVQGTTPSTEYRNISFHFIPTSNSLEFRTYFRNISEIQVDSVTLVREDASSPRIYESESLANGSAGIYTTDTLAYGARGIASFGNSGYLQFGPYDTFKWKQDTPYTAQFRLSTQYPSVSGTIGWIDVYDSGNDKRLALTEIRGTDLLSTGTGAYAVLPLTFTLPSTRTSSTGATVPVDPSSHSLEFRVYAYSASSFRVDRVVVTQSSGSGGTSVNNQENNQTNNSTSLSSLTIPESLIATYEYDALGRRIQTVTPEAITTYLSQGDSIVSELTTERVAQVSLLSEGNSGVPHFQFGQVSQTQNQNQTTPTNLTHHTTLREYFLTPHALDDVRAVRETYMQGVLTELSDARVFGSGASGSGTTTTTTNATTTITQTLTNPTTLTVANLTSTLSSNSTTPSLLATNTHYFHTDHLGSIKVLTNSSGSIVSLYRYDAFGTPYVGVEEVSGSGTTQTTTNSGTTTTTHEYQGYPLTWIELSTLSHLSSLSSDTLQVTSSLPVSPLSHPSLTSTLTSLPSISYTNTRLFTGREYDSETGFYYYRARHYNPQTGRFLQRDPIGQNDQINLYTYVGNSPVMYVDPMGREKEVITSIFKGAIPEFQKIQKNGFLNSFGKWNELSTNKYDLVHFDAGGKNGLALNENPKFNRNHVTSDKQILLDGKYYSLGEVSNVLVGFNAYNVGYSEGFLNVGAMIHNIASSPSDGNGVVGEYVDQQLYNAGYALAKEVASGKEISTEAVMSAINTGTADRYNATQNYGVGDTLLIGSLEILATPFKTVYFTKSLISGH